MAKGQPINELKAWREARGLTMEAAGARILIDGRAANRSTWHAWESGRKVPQYAQMIELVRVTGLEASVFYELPPPAAPVPDPLQPALL